MKTLEELRKDKSTFSIGLALSDGWKLVSKFIGYYILGGVLTVIIGMAVGIIPIVGGIANNIILSPCLMAGAVYVTWRISKGIGWTDFGDMFKGFKYLAPVAISTLIQSAVYLLLVCGFFLNYIDELIDLFKLMQGSDAFTNQEEIQAVFMQMVNTESVLLFFLMMVAMMMIAIIWAFKIHFIVIYNMQAWPAMEMSRKIASNNFLSMIGFFLLMGLIIIVSIIPCGIGLLFSLPLMIGATYSAFAQITHCDEADEIDNNMFDFVPHKEDR